MATGIDYHNQTHVTSWANLPAQVLEVIKSKLYASSLVRFTAVCKRWREFGNKLRPITDLPWPAVHSCEARLTYVPPKFEVEFAILDPHEGKTHKARFDVPESSSYLSYNDDLRHSSRVYASRCGWVLVEEESPIGSRSINLYNPFANRVFPLPDNFDNFRVSAATFSSDPKSPDCALFVVFRCDLNWSYIGTYQYTDENWGWTVHKISEDPRRIVKSMVYCEGEAMVYYVFEDGTLGNFDFLEEISRIYDDTKFYYRIDSIHLIEYEGDILLASGIVNQDREYEYDWIVSKFDRDAMSWVWDGLQGRTLFVSEASFCVPAVQATVGNLGGCVCNFFFDGKFWSIYSLRDRSYTSPENFGWKRVRAEDEDVVGEKSFWIEPPHLQI